MIDIQEFITNFGDQLEEMDPAMLVENTKFKELEEWNSLTALSIMAMIAEEYDVEIKGDDIRHAETLGDLFNIVNSKIS